MMCKKLRHMTEQTIASNEIVCTPVKADVPFCLTKECAKKNANGPDPWLHINKYHIWRCAIIHKSSYLDLATERSGWIQTDMKLSGKFHKTWQMCNLELHPHITFFRGEISACKKVRPVHNSIKIFNSSVRNK